MEIALPISLGQMLFFVSASYSKVDKELQTGSVQSKVYGMAERAPMPGTFQPAIKSIISFWKNMQLNAALSHTWDHSLTTDTAYRKYDWERRLYRKLT